MSHVVECRSSYYLVYEIYFVLHLVICIVRLLEYSMQVRIN